jgi:hypothetical protein
MKKVISILVIILCFAYGKAQDIQYVKAENGLVIRESATKGAKRLGILDYGTAVEVDLYTNSFMSLMEKGQEINGEWVRIRPIDAYDLFEEGYVFSGFLTQQKLQKRFKKAYDEFTVSIDGISEKEALVTKLDPDFDAVLIYELNADEVLDNILLNVKHHNEYRSIKVYQKHENSLVISDNESHCDLIHWKHYYSGWKPFNTVLKHKKFKLRPISKLEQERFIEVDIDTLKSEVSSNCGASWGKAIDSVESINDFPLHVVLSKIYIKIVMVDIEGQTIEKIIIFKVPLNSEQNTSYAKI